MLRLSYYMVSLLFVYLFSTNTVSTPIKSVPVLPHVVSPLFVPSPLDTANVPNGDFLAKAEGCTDSFVVPSAISGPTISCGIDLGAIGSKNITRVFTGLVPDSTLPVLVSASTKRGPVARTWVKRNQLHLDSFAVNQAFHRARALMWLGVGGEQLDSLPDPVRVALLSYVYHTGHLPATSRKLRSMSPRAIASLLRSRGTIYVGSNVKSFRRRRSLEANLIEHCCSDALAVCRVTNSISASTFRTTPTALSI
jgi:hypothetical protein